MPALENTFQQVLYEKVFIYKYTYLNSNHGTFWIYDAPIFYLLFLGCLMFIFNYEASLISTNQIFPNLT